MCNVSRLTWTNRSDENVLIVHARHTPTGMQLLTSQYSDAWKHPGTSAVLFLSMWTSVHHPLSVRREPWKRWYVSNEIQPWIATNLHIRSLAGQFDLMYWVRSTIPAWGERSRSPICWYHTETCDSYHGILQLHCDANTSPDAGAYMPLLSPPIRW